MRYEMMKLTRPPIYSLIISHKWVFCLSVRGFFEWFFCVLIVFVFLLVFTREKKKRCFNYKFRCAKLGFKRVCVDPWVQLYKRCSRDGVKESSQPHSLSWCEVLVYNLYYSLTHLFKWKFFVFETCTDPYYLVLNFYQINEGGEIRTRDHLVIKALISCQKTIST